MITRKRLGIASAASILTLSGAWASEINIARELDANNYDPHKTTALAAAEILFMLGDTLVSIEPDMQTLAPSLATSWDVSEDGLTYTFKIRDDVKFCDGRAMTAEDVVYSFNRWLDPATSSPVKWRAGEVESVTAPDATTVVYKLKTPFSELLYQLTQSFATIIDRTQVEALGPDFGIQGMNGTGPYCWESWNPRDRLTMTKHVGYAWGPDFYDNKGEAQIDRLVWQVVPEENTRTIALMTDQTQITQYVPYIALEQLKVAPNLNVVQSDSAFWTYFIGFKIDHPTVADPAVRRAINLALDQDALARDQFFGGVQGAHSYISTSTKDWDPALEASLPPYDVDAANALLDEAGWVPGSDGIREKDGVRLAPLGYFFTGSTWQKLSEYTQAELRKIGVDLQVEIFDATVAWGKMATQEFDAFGMSYPYVSAGDALNLYFPSTNIPTPNRMNWDDAETDQWLSEGKAALDDDTRAEAYGKVLAKVHEAAIWLPLIHEPRTIVSSTRLAPIVPHSNYGAALYKGLDLKLVE